MVPDRDIVLARLVRRMGLADRQTLRSLLRTRERVGGGRIRFGQELIRRKIISPEAFVRLAEEVDSCFRRCGGCDLEFVALPGSTTRRPRCGRCGESTDIPPLTESVIAATKQDRRRSSRSPRQRPSDRARRPSDRTARTSDRRRRSDPSDRASPSPSGRLDRGSRSGRQAAVREAIDESVLDAASPAPEPRADRASRRAKGVRPADPTIEMAAARGGSDGSDPKLQKASSWHSGENAESRAEVLQALASDLGVRGKDLLKQRIGPYRLLGVIAKGAMGVVFRAKHVDMGRIVALKVLRATRASEPEHVERFNREASAIASLKHPNIIDIHDLADLDGRPYFAMDLIEGDDLDKLIKDGRVGSLDDGVRLIEQLARALQCAHEAGILHRDVKPHNVLVDRSDGRAILADFGLARIEDRSRLTMSGDIIGTPIYMAPEQIKGEHEKVGVGVDVYGLGVILYQILSGGHYPFTAKSLSELQHKLLEKEVEPPSSRSGADAGVDLPIEAICLRALEKNPADRFASIGEMADDLKRWLAGEPVTTPVRGATHRRIVREVKKNKGSLAIVGVGLAVGVIAIAAIGGIVLWRQIVAAHEASVAETQEAAPAVGRAFVDASTELRLGLAAAETGDWATARAKVVAAAPALDAADREWAGLQERLAGFAAAERARVLDGSGVPAAAELAEAREAARVALARMHEWSGDLAAARAGYADAGALLDAPRDGGGPERRAASRQAELLDWSCRLAGGELELAAPLPDADLDREPDLVAEAAARRLLRDLRAGADPAPAIEAVRDLSRSQGLDARLRARLARLLGVAVAFSGRASTAIRLLDAAVDASARPGPDGEPNGEWLARVYRAWLHLSVPVGPGRLDAGTLRETHARRAASRRAAEADLTAAIGLAPARREAARWPLQREPGTGAPSAPGHERAVAVVELVRAIGANARFRSSDAVVAASAALDVDANLVEARIERARGLFRLGILTEDQAKAAAVTLPEAARTAGARADVDAAIALLDRETPPRRVHEAGFVPEAGDGSPTGGAVHLVFVVSPSRARGEALALAVRIARAEGDGARARELAAAIVDDLAFASEAARFERARVRRDEPDRRGDARADYDALRAGADPVRAQVGVAAVKLDEVRELAASRNPNDSAAAAETDRRIRAALTVARTAIDAATTQARSDPAVAASRARLLELSGAPREEIASTYRKAAAAQRARIDGSVPGEAGAFIRAGREILARGGLAEPAELDRAARLLTAATRLAPDYTLAHVDLVHLARRRADREAVVGQIATALARNPETEAAIVEQARDRVGQGAFENALSLLDRLAGERGKELDPEVAREAGLLRAEALLGKDDRAAALAELRELTRSWPGLRQAWVLLARAGDAAAGDRVVELAPHRVAEMVAVEVAKAHDEKRVAKTQLASIDDVIARAPAPHRSERAVLHTARARVRRRVQWTRREKTIAILDLAAAAELSVAFVDEVFGRTWSDLGDASFEDAPRSLDERRSWSESVPTGPFLDGLIAFRVAESASGDPERALEAAFRGIEALDTAVARDPRAASALTLRGVLHARTGNLAAAHRDLATAARLAPGEPLPWIFRARVHAAASEADAALEALRIAIRLGLSSGRPLERDEAFRSRSDAAYGRLRDLIGASERAPRVEREGPRGVAALAREGLDVVTRDGGVPDGASAVAAALLVAHGVSRSKDDPAGALADMAAAVEVSSLVTGRRLDELARDALDLLTASGRPADRSALAGRPSAGFAAALDPILRLLSGRRVAERELTEAAATLAKAPSGRTVELLGIYLAARGGDAGAGARILEIAAKSPEDSLATLLAARVELHRGDADAAARWLQLALDAGGGALRAITEDELFAPVRDRVRYR